MKINNITKEELKKCKTDIVYFVEKYCKVSKNGIEIPIKLTESQKNHLQLLNSKYTFEKHLNKFKNNPIEYTKVKLRKDISDKIIKLNIRK